MSFDQNSFRNNFGSNNNMMGGMPNNNMMNGIPNNNMMGVMPNNMMNGMNGINNMNGMNNMPNNMNPQMNQNMIMMANMAMIGQMQNMMMNQIRNMQNSMIKQMQDNQNNQNNVNNTNMNINNNENNSTPNNGMISLIFERSNPDNSQDFKITILTSPNDTIDQNIERYLTKSMEKRGEVIFLFNALELGTVPNQTVISVGLQNQSKIMVVNKRNAVGGIKYKII